MKKLLIRGASLFGEETADLLIEGRKIIEVGKSLSADKAEVIDAAGLVALPGLVDLHTHMREPGGEGAETIETASRAGAVGGYTTLFAMPNTNPVADTAGVVEQVHSKGESLGLVNVQPIGAVTKGQKGSELADIGLMAKSAANVRVFSDDGFPVFDSLIMMRALQYARSFDAVIAQHAQDPRLTEGAQANSSDNTARLGLSGWPNVAEESMIARDVLLAEAAGAKLHICHLSTAGSVDVIRWAKKRGIQVTAEVTPHHLMLTDDLLSGYDPVYKVNPPLRTWEDVEVLREALLDGTIDIIATDHAPHSAETKSGLWSDSANGLIGLEVALPVVRKAMQDRDFSWRSVARAMSQNPARIGSHQAISLEVGDSANIVLIDPDATAWTYTPELTQSKSRNSPYYGMDFTTSIVCTIYRGNITQTAGKVQNA